MKKLNVFLMFSPERKLFVGHLAEANQRVYFEYSTEFLESGLWLSPFKLPPKAGLQEHKDRSFGPLFGLFDDSLPDGWGLLLMDRHFRSLGVNAETVSPLDRLTFLGERTMGALTYYPPASEPLAPERINLHQLACQSYEVLNGSSADILPLLQRAGGSPGGARPKVLVGVKDDELISGEEVLPPDYEHWLIKFHSSHYDNDDGRIEYAYSQMAEAAGICMPPTRLFITNEGDAYFGVARFDRKRDRRYHVHTFGNMIHSNFRIPNCDYEMLLRVTKVLTKNHKDVLKNFRQMVFNVVACNRDDHVKNFAFMMDEKDQWTCTPAYDLTYSPGPGGEHTMTLGGEGRSPQLRHLMKLAENAEISGSAAKSIIDDVVAVVADWPRFASESGVSSQATKTIANEHCWPK